MGLILPVVRTQQPIVLINVYTVEKSVYCRSAPALDSSEPLLSAGEGRTHFPFETDSGPRDPVQRGFSDLRYP